MLTVERRPPTPAELAVAFPKRSAKRRADDLAWCVAPMFGLAVNRSDALAALAAWDCATWPSDAGTLLETAASEEPLQKTRENMERLLRGELLA